MKELQKPLKLLKNNNLSSVELLFYQINKKLRGINFSEFFYFSYLLELDRLLVSPKVLIYAS